MAVFKFAHFLFVYWNYRRKTIRRNLQYNYIFLIGSSIYWNCYINNIISNFGLLFRKIELIKKKMTRECTLLFMYEQVAILRFQSTCVLWAKYWQVWNCRLIWSEEWRILLTYTILTSKIKSYYRLQKQLKLANLS